MPKRITADIDMEILHSIACGMKHTTIAKKYNVSTSYVSKLNTGKKTPDIYIPHVLHLPGDLLSGNDIDIKYIRMQLEQRDLLADSSSVKNYFEQKVNEHIIKAKMYLTALEKLK